MTREKLRQLAWHGKPQAKEGVYFLPSHNGLFTQRIKPLFTQKDKRIER